MSNQNTLSGMTLRDLLKNPDLQHAPATVCGAPSLKGKKTNDEGADTDFMSAFLGPQLWDKNYNSSGFNLEYMDLDEFLCENLNEIPVVETVGWDELMSRSPPGCSAVPQKTPSPHLSPSPHCSSDLYAVSSPCVSPGQHTSPPHSSHAASPASSVTGPMGVSPVRMSSASSTVIRAKAGAAKNAVLETDADEDDEEGAVEFHSASTRSMSPDVMTSSTTPPVSPHSVRVDFQLSEQDLVLSSIPGESTFDPTSHCFTEDELKPQPMIKKSRKIFVPEDLKDERYWVRRSKNNVAAKRSRDARRVKENQIAMRVAYLEKENKIIQDEIEKMRRENAHLKHRLRKYDPSA